MNISVNTTINKSRDKVWATVIDIDNCSNFISSIINLEVLDKPKQGLIGFKWQETRMMFGKEATETMWITEAKDNEFYCTRAESHGSVYLTKIELEDTGANCTTLSMTFKAHPQSFAVKLISSIMTPFIKGSMFKALQADLDDIRKYVESQS